MQVAYVFLAITALLFLIVIIAVLKPEGQGRYDARFAEMNGELLDLRGRMSEQTLKGEALERRLKIIHKLAYSRPRIVNVFHNKESKAKARNPAASQPLSGRA
jgi:hypothetical protein